jgi:hypothetical protein
MCKRATCPKCNKPTFTGCGAHVEQVLGDVPPDERCKCREKSAADGPQGPREGVLKRLFG